MPKKNVSLPENFSAIPPEYLSPAEIVLLRGDHSGRDEMNLAGHPFGMLQGPGH